MQKIIHTSKNGGFVPFITAPRYSQDKMTASKLVWSFDPSLAGRDYDKSFDAYKIVVKVKNGVIEPSTRPETTGEPEFSAGTVAAVTMYNQKGQVIWKASGLSADAVSLYQDLVDGDHATAYNSLLDGGFTIVGSDYGKKSRWQGDTIQTGYGDDIVKAKAGHDYITDNGGTDRYDGGKGFDRLFYSSDTLPTQAPLFGIVVDMAAKTVTGPEGSVDKIKNIEMVIGTSLADTFTASNKGDDFAGLAGNDVFVGGTGWDYVGYYYDQYFGGNSGINANVTTGVVIDGFGDVDSITDIEVVEGTPYNDTFAGGETKVDFYGYDGNDTFVFSGTAKKHGEGGLGADSYIYDGTELGRKNYVWGFEVGVDMIQLRGVTNPDDVTITKQKKHKVISFGDTEIVLKFMGKTQIDVDDFDWSHIS